MTNPSHVELLLIPLIKETYNGKSEKDLVKIKVFRDPTSSMSDLYEFEMSLFDRVNPEEFSVFILNLNMTLVAKGCWGLTQNIRIFVD